MHTPDDIAGDNTEITHQPIPVTLDSQPHHETNTSSTIDTASESLLGLVAQGPLTTPGSSAASLLSFRWNLGSVEIINDLMRADLYVSFVNYGSW